MNAVMPKDAKDFLHSPADRKFEEGFDRKSQRVRVSLDNMLISDG